MAACTCTMVIDHHRKIKLQCYKHVCLSAVKYTYQAILLEMNLMKQVLVNSTPVVSGNMTEHYGKGKGKGRSGFV